MKQLSYLSKLLFVAIFFSMFASCEDTGGGGTIIDAPPVVSLQSGTDFVTGSASIGAEETFKVSLQADKGDNDMSTLTILEDGLEVDASRINLAGGGFGAFSNPYTFANSSEQASFAAEIEIISQSDASIRIYDFRVTDSKGNTDVTSVDIETSTGPLSISFTEMVPFFWTDVTLEMPTTLKFQINASKGGASMETLSVWEDDVEITNLSRLRYNATDDIQSASHFDANPLALVGDAQGSFSWVLWIGTHGEETTKKYTFRVTDANGDSEEVSVNITLDLPATGTAIDSDLTAKLLLNAGGPMGTGGIDLSTGNGTGSNDPTADLKDQGIDNTQATADNWIRKIAPTNGSLLRKPSGDFPAGIGFIQFKEEIQSAFDLGNPITESDLVLIGDVFLVQDVNGAIFIIEVTDVNETSGDNEDYYELAIKQ